MNASSGNYLGTKASDIGNGKAYPRMKREGLGGHLIEPGTASKARDLRMPLNA